MLNIPKIEKPESAKYPEMGDRLWFWFIRQWIVSIRDEGHSNDPQIYRNSHNSNTGEVSLFT